MVGLLSTGHAYTFCALNQQRFNPTIQCTFPFGIVSICIQKIAYFQNNCNDVPANICSSMNL